MNTDTQMAEAALAYVMETAPVLALILDDQHRVVTANTLARKVLPAGGAGSLLAELVVDFANSIDFTWLTAQRGSTHRLTVKTASGLPETYYFRFFPLAEGTLALGGLDFQEQVWLRSEVLGLNRELNNLTRSLHQANAELLELNKLKNQFLGMAAHDLRKPIGIIMTYGEFVLDEAGDTLAAEHRGYLENCLSAVRSMKRLIDDFLDVSVIESGNLRLELMPASTEEIVDGILPICRLLAEKKKVTLLVDFANGQRRLPVDAPKWQQVLLNLVGNAVEHSSAGQCVWLSTQWDGQSLVFVVRDEGPGIDREEQGRLFAAFERGGTRKTANERSIGLGLAIAHKIVEAHGGRLWVESTPGVGATFFAALPFNMPGEILKVAGRKKLMKPEIHGQPPTLMEELKASTFALHERLQEAPFFQAMAASQLPIESYVGQLRALSVIHGALEQGIESSPDETVASVWDSDMRKLPMLQEDLRYFEPRVVADIKEPVEQALKIAGDIRLHSLRQPLALLGYVYVFEGSTLGTRVLRPQVARAFHLADDDGLCYLNNYGPAVDAHWSLYRQRMDALLLGPDERRQVVQAACAFFAMITSVFTALYPFKPESKAYLAVSINPEAGRHPVPADVREIQASLKAADCCWQRFPYYEARYGERGQRFAKSDGAWLATLCQFDQTRIDQQARWLGRVLAARGMPTLLLQAHLEILVDELATAVPEKKPLYEKLRVAATGLRECRCQQIDDGYLQILDGEFNRAVGPEWSERVRHAGLLLAAAVADERNGNAGAIDGIRHWMADASRFPGEWIAAVQETLAKAQAYARLRDGQGGQSANPAAEPPPPELT